MSTTTVNREKLKPKYEKRKSRFSTRRFRFWAQVFSSAIIVWIGYEFFRFVSFYESSATGTPPVRPPGVEGFLPISGLISLRDWWQSGNINLVHPASLIILLVIIATAILFKKGFCSWVCPVGFISEMIGNVGDKITRARWKLPKALDWPLRSLKYLLLGFFVWAVFISMSASAIQQFVASPYNKIADVKMLKFFTEIDSFGLWTLIILFVLSIFLRGFWCRYLCPYGAFLGIFSLLGPAKIRRDKNLCIDCGKCAKACPSFIKVDQIKQVVSDECTGCLDCIDVCPARGSLELGVLGRRKRIHKKVWAYALVILFWGSLLIFKLTGPWQNNISPQEYRYHIEHMNGAEYGHPGRR